MLFNVESTCNASINFFAVFVACLLIAGCSTTHEPVRSKDAPEQVLVEPMPSVSTVSAQTQSFSEWVAQFTPYARAQGIDEATLQLAFTDVKFLPRVIELDRAQPEFTRPVWDYLDSAVSTQRVARGSEKLKQLRPVLDGIAARYAVPAEVLMAIWGVESNFGTHVGDIPVIDALATLGFDGRREAWARGQLLAALKILQTHDIDRSQMLGSWAGAMGQTQFLPTVYLAYAVDADGDGRRDIWGSTPDVMASTANFLARSGWQAGQAWGAEVQLPPGFDYAHADPEFKQSSTAWALEGVQTMDGSALPHLPDGTIWLPVGARGPAFLTGANFRTLLRYNNSNSYALAVSLLAQRLAGGAPVRAAWPKQLQLLNRSQVQALQVALNARGFDSGNADGVMGPATQRAVRRYQQSRDLTADGFPTAELLLGLQSIP